MEKLKDHGQDRKEYEKLRKDNPDAMFAWEKHKRNTWLRNWGMKYGKKVESTISSLDTPETSQN